MKQELLIRAIEKSDFSAIIDFMELFVPSYLTYDRLEWFESACAINGNEPDHIGWLLEVEKEIKGVHFITPFQGVKGINYLISHSLYVDAKYHGMISLMLFKKIFIYRKQFTLMATSANANSAKLWRALKATPVSGSEEEYYTLSLSRGGLVEVAAKVSRKVGRIIKCLVGFKNHPLIGNFRDGRASSCKEIVKDCVDWNDCIEKYEKSEWGHKGSEEFLSWWLKRPDENGNHIFQVILEREVYYFGCSLAYRGKLDSLDAITITCMWGDSDLISQDLERLIQELKKIFTVVSIGFRSEIVSENLIWRRRRIIANRWQISDVSLKNQNWHSLYNL